MQPFDGQNPPERAPDGSSIPYPDRSFLVLVPDPRPSLDPPPTLRAEVLRARGDTGAWIEELELGEASKRALRASFEDVLGWAIQHYQPNLGSLAWFVRAIFFKRVWAPYARRIPPARCARELEDQREREAILAEREAIRSGGNPDSLTTYLEKWRGSAERWASVGRFRVPGMTPEDVAGTLSLELLAALRDGGDAIEAVGAPGKAATFCFLANARERLRTRTELFVAWEAAPLPVAPLAPTPEDQLIEAQDAKARVDLPATIRRASEELTKPQRRWLAAFRMEANHEGKFNLARAARQLGKDRASASRAVRALARHFSKFGLDDLVRDGGRRSARRRRRRW